MFSWFKKKTNAEGPLANLADWEKNCPDCDTQRGSLHDLFCTKERCPFCQGQLLSCECIYEVLALDGTERELVEEFVDDSVEPLAGIMQRWKVALTAKGRIPFQSWPLSQTPESLILVAARGALPFVRTLLAAGIPVNAANEVGYTALMAAAGSGRSEVLEFLLQAGADVQAQDKDERTPLDCAVGFPASGSSLAEAQSECVRLLLKHGALPDGQDPSGHTPLMTAAWFGGMPSVEQLLKAGAELTRQDERGRTAADLARERGHESIAVLLASHRSKAR